jgi:DNA-binding CsgD family transcriptional regulator
MAELYRLTQTELRVLRDAIENSDLAGIGQRLGMASATTRTHLHRIYDKTDTRSFAGLSNLAHRFGRLSS